MYLLCMALLMIFGNVLLLFLCPWDHCRSCRFAVRFAVLKVKSASLTASPAGHTRTLNPALLTHTCVAKMQSGKATCSVTSVENMPLYRRHRLVYSSVWGCLFVWFFFNCWQFLIRKGPSLDFGSWCLQGWQFTFKLSNSDRQPFNHLKKKKITKTKHPTPNLCLRSNNLD